MQVAIVIPTLNEAENLAILLPQLLALEVESHVIIVDDGSQDNTCEVVKSFQRGCSAASRQMHLIERGRKLGYASAVQDGMRFALSKDVSRIIQMDADLSHDPQYLPPIIQQAQDFDLVIGSRYVAGGGTSNWGLSRQLLSKGGNYIARIVLKLPVRDCTGGFRCWNAMTLASTGILSIEVEGYAFLFTSLELVHRRGASIKEVPIIFADRRYGASKMSMGIVKESMSTLLKIWLARKTGPVHASFEDMPTKDSPGENL